MKTIQNLPCPCQQRMTLLLKRNDAVLNDLRGDFYTVKADGKIPDNSKYPQATIQAAHNQNQTNKGGLTKFLKFVIDGKVI